MVRKHPNEYIQLQVKRTVAKELVRLKVHPKVTYNEVIENLLKEKKK